MATEGSKELKVTCGKEKNQNTEHAHRGSTVYALSPFYSRKELEERKTPSQTFVQTHFCEHFLDICFPQMFLRIILLVHMLVENDWNVTNTTGENLRVLLSHSPPPQWMFTVLQNLPSSGLELDPSRQNFQPSCEQTSLGVGNKLSLHIVIASWAPVTSSATMGQEWLA